MPFGAARSAGSRTFFLVLLLIAVGQVLIVEFGGPVFRTTPLTWVQWLEVIGYTSLIAILGDVVRSIRRRIKSPSRLSVSGENRFFRCGRNLVFGK